MKTGKLVPKSQPEVTPAMVAQIVAQTIAALQSGTPATPATPAAPAAPATPAARPKHLTFSGLPKIANGSLTKAKKTGRERYEVSIGTLRGSDGVDYRAYLSCYPPVDASKARSKARK